MSCLIWFFRQKKITKTIIKANDKLVFDHYVNSSLNESDITDKSNMTNKRSRDVKIQQREFYGTTKKLFDIKIPEKFFTLRDSVKNIEASLIVTYIIILYIYYRKLRKMVINKIQNY